MILVYTVSQVKNIIIWFTILINLTGTWLPQANNKHTLYKNKIPTFWPLYLHTVHLTQHVTLKTNTYNTEHNHKDTLQLKFFFYHKWMRWFYFTQSLHKVHHTMYYMLNPFNALIS